MASSPAALVDALGGTAGALPPPGVLHVVAVPRFDPSATSLRAALVVAAADELRRPPELPPDVLGPLVRGTVVEGTVRDLDPTTLDLDGRRVVQLVASASQTSAVVVEQVARLREAGIPVALVGSVSERDSSLLADGIAAGVARSPSDPALDQLVLAADRPDVAAWRRALSVRGLLDHTPVVLVERAGTALQSSTRTTLAALAHREPAGPVMVVAGDDVVGPVDWRDRLPLRGRTVVNCRARHQAPALTARLRDLGATVLEAPLLATAPGDVDGLDAAVRRCARGEIAALCLTSPNGVRALAAAVDRAGLDARALAPVGVVACVGPGTAAELRRLLAVESDLVAGVHTTVGLAEDLGVPPTPGATALLPRADLATEELRDRLTAAGWHTDEVVAYRTITRGWSDDVAAALAAGAADLVPVLSSSMAEALVAAGRTRGVRAAIVSIGPVTSATLRSHGVEPIAEASTHDLDGLVDAVVTGATLLGRRAARD